MNDLHIQRRQVSALIPYIRNARTHSPEQIAQIAARRNPSSFFSILLSFIERKGNFS